MRENPCSHPAHWSLLSSTPYSSLPPRQHRAASTRQHSLLALSDVLMTSYAHNHGLVNFASGSQYHPHHSDGPSSGQLSHSQRRQKFVAELSQCLLDFVIQLLPTVEELAVKEDVRKLLERLIRSIEPQSRLLSFGSTANGFSLRNSDMDLCCLIDSEERLSASDLVTMVGDLLERETKFHVKPLPHARIPIVKLSLDPSPGLPLGIACDIGFENRLALENTRLLLCYSMVDPTRVRTLVLFLKVWSKRRKINSPYEGTLSSYGYVLLVIYFLVHVKNPPVLPNLQQIPPLHPIPREEHHLQGRNIWFFDDIELLRQRWKSQNTQSVAELLIDFFRFYAKDFTYNTGVASIRAGLLKKELKGWQSDIDPRFKDGRERNRLCIEDPFEVDYNVSRCVTREGLYVIRGEFMRASRVLQIRQERGYHALAQLCEERDDSHTKTNAAHNTLFVPPRLSIPPQTPYSVGSNSFRQNGTLVRDRLSPPRQELRPESPAITPNVRSQSPPEHMAPKRTRFTSPPPPEAPEQDVASFESLLSIGLTLATAATDAREREKAYMSSSSNSEILSDDGDAPSDIAQEDDVKSVQSFTGDPSSQRSPTDVQASFSSSSISHRISAGQLAMAYQQANLRSQDDMTPTPLAHSAQYSRGRRAIRGAHEFGHGLPPVSYHIHPSDFHRFTFPGKGDGLRRSNSGPARAGHSPRMHLMTAASQQVPYNVPLPPSPVHPSLSSSPTVFYETNAQGVGSPSLAPVTTAVSINPFTLYQQQYYLAHAHAQAQAQGHLPQANESSSPRDSSDEQQRLTTRHIHSHTHSTSTIVGPPTPAASSFGLTQLRNSSPNDSQHSSRSHSPAPVHTSFTRLQTIPPPQPSGVTPSPPHSAMSSSFRSSPTSPHHPSQHASVPRNSPTHLSPHLSSHLPHFTRRQSQVQTQGYSIAQAQMHPQMLISNSAGAQFSVDLASPTDSPASSISSRAGSVSGSGGSAGSPGSLSPVSSTSPRTADFSSPRAPSPDRRLHKHAKAADQQRSHHDQNTVKQSQERRHQPFAHVPRQNKYRPEALLPTRAHRVTVPLKEGQTESAQEEVGSIGNGRSFGSILSIADRNNSPRLPVVQSPRTSQPLQFTNEHAGLATHNVAEPGIKEDIALASEPPALDRIEEGEHESVNAEEDWERISHSVSRLQI